MDQVAVPDHDDSEPGNDPKGESVVPPDGQGPPPEHLARLARLVEQNLPPALRGDGTGFD